ncbi:hypothetical protein [Telluribacter sp. SYSU D00476]|uniref:hypothetical protein n=1 Tax=Telluribacter sp. SYSU D00476 TaxID=2811430 RepID=UPI001FF26257|nr:hypothetical protein [Telluribacter sp. SYSU D00476]
MKDFSRQWMALSLLFLMLVKAWVMPLLYLDYELRRDYIIKNLCVNRNRPQLRCNGKCYLAKRLADSRKQEERQAEQSFMYSLLVQVAEGWDHPTLFQPPQTQVLDLPTPSYSYTASLVVSTAVDDIFHPPSVA